MNRTLMLTAGILCVITVRAKSGEFEDQLTQGGQAIVAARPQTASGNASAGAAQQPPAPAFIQATSDDVFGVKKVVGLPVSNIAKVSPNRVEFYTPYDAMGNCYLSIDEPVGVILQRLSAAAPRRFVSVTQDLMIPGRSPEPIALPVDNIAQVSDSRLDLVKANCSIGVDNPGLYVPIMENAQTVLNRLSGSQ